MIRSLIVLFCCAYTMCIWSCAEEVSNSAAKYDKLMFYCTVKDIGKIKKGSIKRVDFEYENLSSIPYHIENIRSSCGCTVVSFSDNKIGPFEKGFIPVKFFSEHKSLGDFDASVKISINEIEQDVQLSIKGNIYVDFEFQPKQFTFGRIGQSDTVSSSIYGVGELAPGCEVVSIGLMNPDRSHLFKVTTSSKRSRNGTIPMLVIEKVGELPLGPLKDSVKIDIKMKDGIVKSYLVDVVGYVEGIVDVMPRHIYVYANREDEIHAEEIQVWEKNRSTISIEKVLVLEGNVPTDKGFIKVRTRENEENLGVVQVFVENVPAGTDFSGSIRIIGRSNDASFGKEVPIVVKSK